jgi:hypothetical protein
MDHGNLVAIGNQLGNRLAARVKYLRVFKGRTA